MKRILILFLLFVCIVFLGTLLFMGIPITINEWNIIKSYVTGNRYDAGQIQQAVSFACTIGGTVLFLLLVRQWLIYRNEEDPNYWNGGYSEISYDIVEVHPASRRGGGKAAMHEGIDIHETVSELARNPAAGQHGRPGIKI